MKRTSPTSSGAVFLRLLAGGFSLVSAGGRRFGARPREGFLIAVGSGST